MAIIFSSALLELKYLSITQTNVAKMSTEVPPALDSFDANGRTFSSLIGERAYLGRHKRAINVDHAAFYSNQLETVPCKAKQSANDHNWRIFA